MILPWSYPEDMDNLVSGLGRLGQGTSTLGQGPSRLDHGSSDPNWV